MEFMKNILLKILKLKLLLFNKIFKKTTIKKYV